MHTLSESVPTAEEMRDVRAAFPPSLVVTTPLERHERLSNAIKRTLCIKGEDVQTVRSYKVRGATATCLALTDEERNQGIGCASAGNHAQGVAANCATFAMDGTVFMPRTTPRQKIEATERRGKGRVEIRLEGDTFDETAAYAYAHMRDHGITSIHPFDDWNVIKGQGTVAVEISDQMRDMREKIGAVIVPVGGGGLLAGTVLALRASHPDTLIVGVEPDGAASMAAAVRAGKPVTLPKVDSFVDGAAVMRVGDRPFRVVQDAVREGRVRLMTVSKGFLCATMADLIQIDGRITEPAGALSIAAAATVADHAPDGAIVSIVSGNNLDMRRMPKILQHADLYRRTKAYVQVTLPDRPRALQSMLDAVGDELDPLNICFLSFDDEKQQNGDPPATYIGFESKAGRSRDIDALLHALRARCPDFAVRELDHKPDLSAS
jgi:threonine dehydratase